MKILIIAPHIDDELIGCWSVFQNPDNEISIRWLYELTDQRLTEGKRLVNYSKYFAASIKGIEYEEPWSELQNFDQIYVPSRKDSHFDHKQTNAKYRKFATHFYSVDMDNGVYLGSKDSYNKRVILDTVYPSQKSLWDTNAKYYLFESIVKKDYNEKHDFMWNTYAISVPVEFADRCKNSVDNLPKDISRYQLMDELLSICWKGSVELYSIYDPKWVLTSND